MKADKIIGILLILISAFMYWQADQLPEGTFGTKGADFFPKIIFALLALAGSVLTVNAYLPGARSKLGSTSETHMSGTVVWETIVAHKNVIVAFLLFFGYVILMYYLGYLISTTVFMPTMMWYLGPRTRKSAIIAAAVTIGVGFGLYLCFVNLLKIFLPSGRLF